MKREPIYLKVYEELKKQINEGEYSVGELLPAEPELEKGFNVSRTTVRKAIELLSREGILEVKQGKGTKVLDYKTEQTLNGLTSITETLIQKGYDVKTKSIYIDVIQASKSVANDLGIEENSEVIRIQRIQAIEKRPIAIMNNYLLPEMVPHIEEYMHKFISLYSFLADRYNINITATKDKITAKSANFVEAEMLQVPIGKALLCMKRICFMQSKPVCVDRVSIIGETYEFEVNSIN